MLAAPDNSFVKTSRPLLDSSWMDDHHMSPSRRLIPSQVERKCFSLHIAAICEINPEVKLTRNSMRIGFTGVIGKWRLE